MVQEEKQLEIDQKEPLLDMYQTANFEQINDHKYESSQK